MKMHSRRESHLQLHKKANLPMDHTQDYLERGEAPLMGTIAEPIDDSVDDEGLK